MIAPHLPIQAFNYIRYDLNFCRPCATRSGVNTWQAIFYAMENLCYACWFVLRDQKCMCVTRSAWLLYWRCCNANRQSMEPHHSNPLLIFENRMQSPSFYKSSRLCVPLWCQSNEKSDGISRLTCVSGSTQNTQISQKYISQDFLILPRTLDL